MSHPKCAACGWPADLPGGDIFFSERLSKPLWLSGVNLCLSGTAPAASVCTSMGVTYCPKPPPSLADLAEFRIRILDPAVYTRVQAGSETLYRLVEIGTAYRNSHNGASFEARREGGGLNGPTAVFPHVQDSPFRFLGWPE